MGRLKFIIYGVFISLALGGGACSKSMNAEAEKEAPGTTSTIDLDDDTFRGIAQEAYLYGAPPAEIARLRSIRGFSGTGTNQAKRNSFAHLRNIIPAGTGTCCPNRDTLYSLAWLDVSSEPLILTIPPTSGRYFVVQVTDILTRNKPALSRRTVGSGGGKYLITGPDWTGALPQGAVHYPLGSNEGLALLRISPNGEGDIGAVNDLQDKFTLSHPSGAPISAELFEAHNPDNEFEVYKWLDHTLRNNPSTGRDKGIASTMGAIGLGGDKIFDPSLYSERQRQILRQSKSAAHALLVKHLEAVGNERNGWIFLIPGDELEHDVFARAAIAIAYILPNDRKEALYPMAMFDSKGRRLNSKYKYRLRFEGPAPAQAFWSLTSYDYPGVHLIPNPYEKYAVGDRTDSLVLNADNGVDILISKSPPAERLEPNWLPVPEGDFMLVLRLYEPTKPAVTETWTPPSVVRIE